MLDPIPMPNSGATWIGELTVPAGSDAGPVYLPVIVVRGAHDGPRVCILGGVHGDEPEGVLAAARLGRNLDPSAMTGTVIIVTVANPPAFAAFERLSPIDGKNLARTFPGAQSGSVTDRIADFLTQQIIHPADYLIDLHSAGHHASMPMLCGAFAGPDDYGRRNWEAVLAFGAPVAWGHPDLGPGRSLTIAREAGIPAIYVECGGGGRARARDLDAYDAGVRRVLSHWGLLAPTEPASPPVLTLHSSGDLDTAIAADRDGLLVETARPLDVVKAGDLLGEIRDRHGSVLQQVRAPSEGIVIMARRTAAVRTGDGLYMLARKEGMR